MTFVVHRPYTCVLPCPAVDLPPINVVPLADPEDDEPPQNNNEKPAEADERAALLRHSSGESGGMSEKRLRRVESQTSNEPMSPAEKVCIVQFHWLL